MSKPVGQPAEDDERSGAVLARTDPSEVPSTASLRSLAPEYDPKHHDRYLRRLQTAVEDPRNKNIALMGRYGTGKSSILDQFEREYVRPDKVLRISINTLGAPAADADITNRIQKELVRHLTYRAAPGQLRHSRFARIKPFSWKRASAQAAVATALLGLFLFLLGWLPDVPGDGSKQRGLAWAGLAAVTWTFALFLRWALDGRVVSDVSAAGAAVKISERSDTYFDEYLEEIAYFFDSVKPHVVIFEDLDRFEDPYIFDSLRELNTLLNASPTRQPGQPIRFIYAIRDSLFTQLGHSPRAGADDRYRRGEGADNDGSHPGDASTSQTFDPAVVESQRANRTKFFEIVIPVVPFISHRNARELMVNALERQGWAIGPTGAQIDRQLIDTVARHTTEMRLLLNICNEFTVFAEHLLGPNEAPGLDATGLFALVAYKNFHLEDFELISRRESALDKLEHDHTRLVRQCITQAETQRRELLRERRFEGAKRRLARSLGKRLNFFATAVRSTPNYRHLTQQGYLVGEQKFTREQSSDPSFWAAAVAGAVKVTAGQNTPFQTSIHQFSDEEFASLFPEAGDAKRWAELDAEELARKFHDLDETVAFLQGADFADLARHDEHTLDSDGTATNFRALVARHLTTDLGRDLVTQGFLDRNFALYAAQFYGEFAGVDVAQFLVQAVQRNQMKVDHRFSSSGAIENLLSEAPPTFTRSISVLNLQVFDHLLANPSNHTERAVSFLIAGLQGEARSFLEAYFNSGHERRALASQLAAHGWPAVLTYLATSDEVPDDDERPALVSDALLALPSSETAEVDGQVAAYLEEHHADIGALSHWQPDAKSRVVYKVAEAADITFHQLAALGGPLRDLAILGNRYALTAENLRSATINDESREGSALTLERLRTRHAVWNYCVSRPDTFLAALRSNEQVEPLTADPAELADALGDLADWSEEQVAELCQMTAADLGVRLTEQVPQNRWQVLARCQRLEMTLENLHTYIEQFDVDPALAVLLTSHASTTRDAPLHEAGGEADADEDGSATDLAETVANAIVNAHSAVPDPATRAQFVKHLCVASLRLDAVVPEAGNLLLELLAHGLLEEDAETYRHFIAGAGWAAAESAARSSEHFLDLLSPEVLGTAVTDLLLSAGTTPNIRSYVLRDLDLFVPADDIAALKAAAQASLSHSLPMSAAGVERVVRGVWEDDYDLVVEFLASTSARDLPTPDLVRLLALLPAPLSYFSSRERTEFEMPTRPSEERLVRKLASRRLAKVEKRRRKPGLVHVLTVAPPSS